MYKYYKRIFNILLITFLLFSNIAYSEKANKRSFALATETAVNYNIIVGLLKTDESQDIYQVFNNFGIKTVLIDYDKIINLKEIQEELAKQDAKKLTLNPIKADVVKFIKEHKINRTFISDNLHSGPNPHRQLVAEAIVVVDDSPALRLLGICGGLQGIISNQHKQRMYHFSRQRLSQAAAQQKWLLKFCCLTKIAVFNMVSRRSFRSSKQHTRKQKNLELLGYKIAAFSNDGVTEAVEDKHGNIYFPSLPEALLVRSDKNLYSPNHKARQIPTLAAIAIIKDFLHHAWRWNNENHVMSLQCLTLASRQEASVCCSGDKKRLRRCRASAQTLASSLFAQLHKKVLSCLPTQLETSVQHGDDKNGCLDGRRESAGINTSWQNTHTWTNIVIQQ